MITVRPARTDELNSIMDFYSELIESMRDSEFKPEWEMGVYPTEQLLKDAIEAQTLFLAHLENHLVGTMIMNHICEPEYEKAKWRIEAKNDEVMAVHLLGVSPAYQGRGIARQMVSSLIEMCRRSPIKAIRLDVLKKNAPAAKLYASMGFQFIESVKIFYEDTGLTDFLLYELII